MSNEFITADHIELLAQPQPVIEQLVSTGAEVEFVSGDEPSVELLHAERPAALVTESKEVVLLTAIQQGPEGAPGDPSGAFLIDERLSELGGDPTAQSEAQENMGLGIADFVAYYTLAKS